MYSIYFIVSNKTEYIYVGMTKHKLNVRLNQHRHQARLGRKSPLYDCMRKHGSSNFEVILKETFDTLEKCKEAEKSWITHAREKTWKLLNLADGGNGGYVIPDEKRASWIDKLIIARKGKKPALGLKHTEENKKFFSECSKRRMLLYTGLDVTKVSFEEANLQFNISRTHYYRLLRKSKGE